MSTRARHRAGVAALAAIPLVVLAVFFVLPVCGMVARGFWPNGELDVAGVLDVLARPRVHRVVWFTLWSATLATAVTVLVGMPVSYVLYRLAFPGRQVLRALVTVPFVLPTVVVGVAFRTLLAESGPLGGLGLDGTATAIIAALVFFNISVVVRTVGGVWEGLDRRPAEAAAALGASPAQVFWTVTLPTMRQSIVSAASVVFLFCATSFGVVLTLGGLRYSTVETEIYLLTTQFLDLQAAAALSILQLVVVAVLLFLTARAKSTRSGRQAVAPRRPSRRHLPLLAVTAVVLVFLVAPIATLVVRSLTVDGAWSVENYRNLGSVQEGSALLVPVTEALFNSVRIAVDATLIAVSLALMVSVVVSRVPRGAAERRTLGVLDGLFMLPLGVSAVTVGFGYLITLDRPPLDLRSSAILVPIAQAMVALPLVVRTIAPLLRSIDDRQRQAAASLGAGPLRVLATVDLPLVWRPLLAATGLAFAVSLGEFGATSFLARPDYPTLPVVVFHLIGRPGAENFGMALAASVVLAVVTVVVMGVVERLHVGSMGAF
jgi:thiamine transport system permease protein